MLVKSIPDNKIKRPTLVQNAEIETAAANDPDAPILTDAEWVEVRPRLIRGISPKEKTLKNCEELKLSDDVVNYFRNTGKGWQTRMDLALKEWIASR